MLVCPQCQSENPDQNNFCQQCGASLTQKSCPECGAMVAFDAKQCEQCGAPTATIWQAIVYNPSPSKATNFTDISTTSTTPTSAQPSQAIWGYLDRQQRYQLLEPWPTNLDPSSEVAIQVLDRQPFQMSLLETWFYQAQGEVADSEESMSQLVSAQTPEPENPKVLCLVNSEPGLAIEIPAAAQPYLALQAEFYNVLPGIHDAWQQDEQAIILLENRAHFPLLLDVWRDDDIPLLQLLYWLREMVDLWDVLLEWECSRSLIELSNLRVDEDQVLCLQRLYSDPDTKPSTLQELGQTWQTLFDESQRTQIATLGLFLSDLQKGKIANTDELRAYLDAIAYEVQTTLTSDTMTSDPSLSQAPEAISSYFPIPASETSGSATSPAANFLATSESGDDSNGDDAPTVVLPMQLISLEDAGHTDVGRQRDHNEDYFGIHTEIHRIEGPQGRTVQAKGLYILCDGMGGHASGEVASALAVDTLRRYFQTHWLENTIADPGAGERSQPLPSEEEIREAIQLANRALYDINQQNARSGSGRMGTTLVMALVHDTNVAIAHVGDSRLYRLSRRQGLEQITVDHEVGQREIQRGVEPDTAYARPDAYQLTQALGPRDENFISPDIHFFDVHEDTILLLCSDGLSDHDLLENHWQTHLEPLLRSQAHLEQGVIQLIDLANQYNGHDNITAIAIRLRVRPNLAQLRQLQSRR